MIASTHLLHAMFTPKSDPFIHGKKQEPHMDHPLQIYLLNHAIPANRIQYTENYGGKYSLKKEISLRANV